MPRRVLRPREVQRRLGIGHTRFYEIVGSGKLRLVRLGERSVGIIEDELDSYTPIPSVSEKWLARAGGNNSCCGHDSGRLS